ncbi:MAG: pyridoxal phosphate-dependent aminotransferase [Syntrophobacterales bacterium]|nr:MAG: pyridoxal phosphate-dependent aminotransferase [Syntrophobacterales bacterium]
MTIARRAQQIKPSATLTITAKAKAMKAEGIDVIGFGAGEPDFDTPDHIKRAAIKALEDGFTKYTAVGGIDELKDAVIRKFKRDNGLDFDRAQILVSCGGKHCLYNLAQVLFDTGDEVIIPSPYWVSYPPIVTLASANPVILETTEESGFKMDPDDLRRTINKKTKALVLNSPCNPTGMTYTESELKRIADIILESGIYVISDEIYEKIVYDGLKYVSIASLGEDIKERTIIVHGVSKTYSMTGWRIGFTAGPSSIIGAMNKIQGQSTSNPTSISQKASQEALNGPQDIVQAMVGEFQKRRDYIIDRLNSLENVSCVKPAGAFYVFPNISSYLGKSFKGEPIRDSIHLADYLLDVARVAVVPGAAFGAEGYERLSFATSMENIEKGMDRVEKALKELA